MGCDSTLTAERFQNFMQQLEVEEKKEKEKKRQERIKNGEPQKLNDEEDEEEEDEEDEEEEKVIENKAEKITIVNQQIQQNKNQTKPVIKQLQNIPKQTKVEENICINNYSGFVVKGLDFKNCIIKSQEELDNNLRLFISPIIPKIKKNDTGFNLDDVIYTNSIKIDFNKYYILALKDVNKIDKVVENNGNYVVYVNEYNKTNNNLDLEKYFALIVKKIKGDPKILFASN